MCWVHWQSGVGGSRVVHLWYAVVTSYNGAAGHVAHPAARGGISVVSEVRIWYDRILPEQRTVAEIVEEMLTSYGNRRFMAAFTRVHHFFPVLSTIKPVETLPTDFFNICSNIILPFSITVLSGLLPSGSSTKTLHAPLLSPLRATCTAMSIFLVWSPEQAQYLIRSTNLVASRCTFPHCPVTSDVLGSVFSSAPCSPTFATCFSFSL